jgi:hypothetical protein
MDSFQMNGSDICQGDILSFHGGDYGKYRLLGYENAVCIPHYVTATEPSVLMLCNISGFHSGDYEKCRLLGYKNPVRTLYFDCQLG